MTAPEKGRWYWFKNWLHYHWLYLIIAAVALWVGISWLGNALHWGETLPDYQIAYVGKSALPEDTAHAIEAAFAQYGEDLNGDGIVSVKLNQYVSDTEDVENASDCPVLAGYDLGTYQTTVLGTTVTGSGAELVNGLFLGRRAFYEEPKNEKAALAREGAQRLWEILTEGATP